MSKAFHGISMDELVERAIRSARNRNVQKGLEHPRWYAVMSAFSLSQAYAKDFCRRFNLDPDEIVK